MDLPEQVTYLHELMDSTARQTKNSREYWSQQVADLSQLLFEEEASSAKLPRIIPGSNYKAFKDHSQAVLLRQHFDTEFLDRHNMMILHVRAGLMQLIYGDPELAAMHFERSSDLAKQSLAAIQQMPENVRMLVDDQLGSIEPVIIEHSLELGTIENIELMCRFYVKKQLPDLLHYFTQAHAIYNDSSQLRWSMSTQEIQDVVDRGQIGDLISPYSSSHYSYARRQTNYVWKILQAVARTYQQNSALMPEAFWQALVTHPLLRELLHAEDIQKQLDKRPQANEHLPVVLRLLDRLAHVEEIAQDVQKTAPAGAIAYFQRKGLAAPLAPIWHYLDFAQSAGNRTLNGFDEREQAIMQLHPEITQVFLRRRLQGSPDALVSEDAYTLLDLLGDEGEVEFPVFAPVADLTQLGQRIKTQINEMENCLTPLADLKGFKTLQPIVPILVTPQLLDEIIVAHQGDGYLDAWAYANHGSAEIEEFYRAWVLRGQFCTLVLCAEDSDLIDPSFELTEQALAAPFWNLAAQWIGAQFLGPSYRRFADYTWSDDNIHEWVSEQARFARPLFFRNFFDAPVQEDAFQRIVQGWVQAAEPCLHPEERIKVHEVSALGQNFAHEYYCSCCAQRNLDVVSICQLLDQPAEARCSEAWHMICALELMAELLARGMNVSLDSQRSHELAGERLRSHASILSDIEHARHAQTQAVQPENPEIDPEDTWSFTL